MFVREGIKIFSLTNINKGEIMPNIIYVFWAVTGGIYAITFLFSWIMPFLMLLINIVATFLCIVGLFFYYPFLKQKVDAFRKKYFGLFLISEAFGVYWSVFLLYILGIFLLYIFGFDINQFDMILSLIIRASTIVFLASLGGIILFILYRNIRNALKKKK